MYGQLTTGKPMFITSRIGKKHPAHRIELRIDTARNQPEILKEQDIPDWESEHGTRVEIELVGKYLKGRQSVDEYLTLTAVANPHVEIAYKPPDGEVRCSSARRRRCRRGRPRSSRTRTASSSAC